MTSVAFSPDGTRLAVGSQTAFGIPEGVDVYQLENRTWHSDLPRACGSGPQDDFLSRRPAHRGALTGLAGCDLGSGLRPASHHLDVPQGEIADNSGLAFSPDGQRFAFSAGHQAKLWDAMTGKESGPGRSPRDCKIRWPSVGPISSCLLRMETQDGESLPDSRQPCGSSSRHAASQLAGQPADRTGPRDHGFQLARSPRGRHPDGKYFVVEGLRGPKGKTRSVNAYDALTGVKLWTLPSQTSLGAAAWFHVRPDREGP